MEREGAVDAAAPASKLTPAVAPMRAMSPQDRVLALQRSVGNRAVERMIAAGRLPPGAQKRPAVGPQTAQAAAGGRLRPELEDATDRFPEGGGWLGDLWDRIWGRRRAPTPTPTAPTPPAAPTTMSIVNVDGPNTENCGKFDWSVNFTLPTASPAGGWFVQELTIRRRATDCADAPNASLDMDHHYWEAWRVLAGGTQDELVANGTFNYADKYWLGSCGTGTKGSFSYTGSVRFYEGLTLPGAFIPNNPATIAHDLPSTVNDPHLPGGTPALSHSIAGTWNCCPAGTTSPTTITSHSP